MGTLCDLFWQKMAKICKKTSRPCKHYHEPPRIRQFSVQFISAYRQGRLMVTYFLGPIFVADVCHERPLASVKDHGTLAEGNTSYLLLAA